MTDFSLYLVTDPELGGGADKVAGIVAAALRGGVSVVQLRDKLVDDSLFREYAQGLKDVCAEFQVPLFVNDRIDIAAELGLHLHIGQEDIPYVQARQRLAPGQMVGLSIENLEQLHRVIAECKSAHVSLPDVIGIGPVRATSTKPDAAPALGVAGVAEIAAVARQHGIASVAIGGVKLDNAAALSKTAISGLCVVSEIMAAASPEAAAAEIKGVWKREHSPAIPRVLTIAGTDPTGGAGVQADLKSIASAGGFGMSAITSLVAQNTHGVTAIHTPPLEFLEEQLESVFSDVEVDAIKIGMLGSADTIAVVAKWLDKRAHGPVVLDPVMIATSGDRLLDPAAEQSLRELTRRVDVITPNIPELAVLCDQPAASTLEEAITQAKDFASNHHTTVIVKGGHLKGSFANNAVVRPDGTVFEVENWRVHTSNTHGTGCSLSAALATRLAAGHDVESALEWATRWLNEALRGADSLQVGTGNGPVDHFHAQRRLIAAADTAPWEHLRQPRLAGNDPTQLVPASATSSPVSHIEPAGPYTAALWRASGDIIAKINDSGFIKGLGSGSLSFRDFRFYIDQDAQYLSQYSRALAGLSAKAPDAGSQVAWAQGAAACLIVEAELHRSYLGEQPEASTAAPSPVTMAYTDFLLARVLDQDYVIGAAAVLPCYWLYAEVGLNLAAQNHPEHPYHAWLETYSSEDFITGTRAAIQRVENALAQAGPQQRVEAARAFLSASMYELEFFDQATRTGWV